ncbi:MAG: SUMF1/EgtB/PvdO family nonheme iron enzyme [Kiritimatiellae bacterium]|nr:SUMF1/EgtB/PvdO family nonheme iron enzyme [Kiritimatiellia bacterium]
MASIQCKMCGGSVELTDGKTFGECPYCGSLTTFPKIKDDKAAQLYARAEHYRRAGEFDKAVATYEAIIADDPSDAEAYWGAVLSRYGIEYVEDPATHERIPTCHRVQYESILADEDYKSVLANSSGSERAIYENEARRIAEIQKGILAVSAQEKPFDVFICYKETDEKGERTKDSALAQEIYYQLEKEGYKVFFARITLEDKLGRAYEPYIFAALNSAKVMLVVGTRKDYFGATWVRNEWSRFLALMKRDHSKLLIPCYRDMDAYDLPEEMSMLQSQDMSKIGFIQDLLHGIGKVIGKDKPGGTTSEQNALSPAETLLDRAAVFLKTGDFDSAASYCEKALDIDPKNSRGYLYGLLAELKLASEEDLANCDRDFENDKNFVTALEFADQAMRKRLNGLAAARKMRLYDSLSARMNGEADTPDAFETIASGFDAIAGYLDAATLAADCRHNADVLRFNAAVELMEGASNIMTLRKAAEQFKSLIGKVDEAEELFRQCTDGANEYMYKVATVAMQRGDLGLAAQQFEMCGNYRDAAALTRKCRELALREARARAARLRLGISIAVASLLLAAGGIALYLDAAKKEKKARAEAEMQRIEAERQRELAEAEAKKQAELEHIAAEQAERARKVIRKIIADMVAIPGTRLAFSKYEMTQGIWKTVMDFNYSYHEGDDKPVDRVTWPECTEFIRRLNALPEVAAAGFKFRLPTEEEWVNACRAGFPEDRWDFDGLGGSLDEVSWNRDNSGNDTHPVGQKKPNGYGLYDMLGNVWEWTSSGSDDGRAFRGGWRGDSGRHCRPDGRIYRNMHERHEDCGFRLAADLNVAAPPRVVRETQVSRTTLNSETATKAQRTFYIDSRSDEGTYIGTFKKGDVLLIQYLSGNWTLNRGKWPYSSSDTLPDIEKEEQHLYGVKLLSKSSKGRILIPYGTSTAPFVMVVEKSGDYMLRSCDWNLGDNDGVAQYGVTTFEGAEARQFLESTVVGSYQGAAMNARGGSITVRSWIDGGDYVCIRDGKVWFVHKDCDLPGVNGHRGNPLPTYVNGTEWHPRWSRQDKHVVSDAFVTSGVVPSMTGAKVWLRDACERGHAHIVEQPTAENDNTLKVDIGDHGLGASWCEFTVYW